MELVLMIVFRAAEFGKLLLIRKHLLFYDILANILSNIIYRVFHDLRTLLQEVIS